ncbi:MAG: alkaline phosphatase family protein [Acidobacteriota bacterium]|nr:alkaline phosphatase family protein [Acidobacteriota bacterium]
MKIRTFALLLALTGSAFPQTRPKPKLVLGIVVDQFRYDYLLRFRKEYNSGFDRLLIKGANFVSAHYEQFPTVTAIGHSTFMSGATPSISGIVGNEWFDRDSGRQVTSVDDDKTKLLGGKGGAGSSPSRLLVSTIGDEMRIADPQVRVLGVSLKDRAAILPAGHMAQGAYWFDGKSGNFVSSSFYFAELPGWVKDFDATHPADKFAGQVWMGKKFASGEKLYGSIPASPWGNELIEAFAERAVQSEQLGQRGITDLLTVSFSSNDYVGHALGPDSPEVHDMSIRTDRLLGKLFAFIDQKIGMQNVLVVMTADHGVAPLPEISQGRKMPGGRMPPGIVASAIQDALTKKYGTGDWFASPADTEHTIYLNWNLIQEKKLDRVEVTRRAADSLQSLPHIFRVFTREQLMNGATLEDQVGRRVMNGFYIRRGADLYVMLEPYWLFSQHGTTHGTTFSYDMHVPVIFLGPGIKAGTYYQTIAVNDIAPTLAAMLGIETPSGSVGRVLSEIFAGN